MQAIISLQSKMLWIKTVPAFPSQMLRQVWWTGSSAPWRWKVCDQKNSQVGRSPDNFFAEFSCRPIHVCCRLNLKPLKLEAAISLFVQNLCWFFICVHIHWVAHIVLCCWFVVAQGWVLTHCWAKQQLVIFKKDTEAKSRHGSLHPLPPASALLCRPHRFVNRIERIQAVCTNP